MSDQPTGADSTPSFDDAVGKTDQPANQVTDSSTEEHSETDSSDKGSESAQANTEQPDATSGEQQEEPPDDGSESQKETEQPEDGKPSDDTPIFGKFKSLDDAKKSYDEAQTKIMQQGRELNDTKKKVEENEKLLSALDQALATDPQLQEQLKTALAKTNQKVDYASARKETDVESLVDRKLAERDAKAKIDKWIDEHPDFKTDTDLANQVFDIIEKRGIPFTADNLDLVYSALTKDKTVDKAKRETADKVAKNQKIADLDRDDGASVGGGSSQSKTDVPDSNDFDSLVGHTINANRLRF